MPSKSNTPRDDKNSQPRPATNQRPKDNDWWPMQDQNSPKKER